MITSNIILGKNVDVDPSTSLNNVKLGNNIKISLRCNIFGSPENPVEIGENSYIGMNTIINGNKGKIIIGKNVSIAQNVILMCDSGPNASLEMQKYFPINKGSISVGDHCWIGAGVIIDPGVILGDFCVVAANSFVKTSYPSHSVIGGNPAKLLKTIQC